jgi:threonine dehydratase
MKTPQQPYPAIAKTIGLTGDLYLKREDLHPYGSHKGRAIPLMIKEYHKEGWNDFVVSSSGNAALAAILAVEKHNKNNPDDPISLTVYIGKNIDQKKKERLQASIVHSQSSIVIKQIERPKQTAFQKDKAGTAKNLRQSTDDMALLGYETLARELNKIPDLRAIFVPTSSGTTAEALGNAFQKLDQNPEIHIVQTTACHPIAEIFDKRENDEDDSLAGAIVDRIAHRKTAVTDAVQKSKGAGWIVKNKEIGNAVLLVKKTTDINISPNSALSIAGCTRAVQNGWNTDGAVACLITGA